MSRIMGLPMGLMPPIPMTIVQMELEMAFTTIYSSSNISSSIVNNIRDHMSNFTK